MVGIGTILGGALENGSISSSQQAIMEQRAEADSERAADTYMAIEQSKLQHEQSRFDMQMETMRSLTNDATKKATEVSADGGAILKDTAQKLDSSSSA